MTQFELFCMVYYALEAFLEEARDRGEKEDDDLVQFLSDANPFIWEGTHSADPAIFMEFCEIMPEEIPQEDSYKLAAKYIADMPYYYSDSVRKAFNAISEEQWFDSLKCYMSQPHKK